jgi:RNA polymerase sigma factor (sigma-70 family)
VDVDDCAQEAWVDLLKTLPAFELDDSRGRFTSWLYSIVRSKAADQVRRRSRRPAEAMTPVVAGTLASAEASPVSRAEAADDGEAVHRALTLLAARSSEQSYRVLHLRQVEGRDVADVAAALGIQPRQVWVTEHRMKRKLRDLLAKAAG